MSRKFNNRFKIRKKISSQRMSLQEWESFEDLLATLVARAYAADNPHLFEPDPVIETPEINTTEDKDDDTE